MMAFLGAKLQNDESRAILGAMFEARAEYLQAAIGEIQKQYGSVEAYAEKALGFTKESLEEMKRVIARRLIMRRRLSGLASFTIVAIILLMRMLCTEEKMDEKNLRIGDKMIHTCKSRGVKREAGNNTKSRV